MICQANGFEPFASINRFHCCRPGTPNCDLGAIGRPSGFLCACWVVCHDRIGAVGIHHINFVIAEPAREADKRDLRPSGDQAWVDIDGRGVLSAGCIETVLPPSLDILVAIP